MRTTKLSPSSKPSLVMSARIRLLMSGRLRSDSVTASPQVGRAGQAMDILSMLSRSTTSLQADAQHELDDMIETARGITTAIGYWAACALLLFNEG